MKVRAAVFRAPGIPFQIEELDLGDPREGEVRVKVKATGVCHSDWHLMTGATKHPLPCVPGHEGAGTIDAVGPGVESLSVGDTVALNWAPNCGSCFYCNAGRPALCGAYVEPIWAGTMMDGTTRLSKEGKPIYHFSALACFAEYAVVPQQCCVRLPKEIPFEVAALIGCAVTTGVGAVFNTAHVAPGSSVAVFGLGGVGLSAVLGARAAGAEQVIAVDAIPEKLAIAQSLGATHCLRSNEAVAVQIRSLTHGRGADTVIECVGIPELQEQCLEAVRPGGVLVLAGLAPVGSTTSYSGASLVRQEKTIMGCYYGTAHPARDFPLYASWYAEGRLPLDRLITRRYSLDEINEAYHDMLSGANARGVVVFS